MPRKHLLDVNLLVALTEPAHQHHRAAHAWFSQSGKDCWGRCPLTEAGFIRVTTNPAYRPQQRSLAQAIAILQSLKAYPGYRYWPMRDSWVELTAPLAARILGHQHVTDAYLLGLAIREDGVLVSFDRALRFLAGEEFAGHLQVLD